MYVLYVLCLLCLLLSQGQASPLSVLAQNKKPLVPFVPESALTSVEVGGIFAKLEIDTIDVPQKDPQDIQIPNQGNLMYKQAPLQGQNKASLDDPLSKTVPVSYDVDVDAHVSVKTYTRPLSTATKVVVRTEDNYAGSMGFRHPRRHSLLPDGTLYCSDILSISSWAEIIGRKVFIIFDIINNEMGIVLKLMLPNRGGYSACQLMAPNVTMLYLNSTEQPIQAWGCH